MYEGALVRLRAVEPEDAAAHHRWWNDRDVTRFLAGRYPVSVPFMQQRAADRAIVTFAAAKFSVERRDTGELIGYTAIRDATPEDRDAELDLIIGERGSWRGGFGTDTTRTVCRFGFEEMNLHRIHLYVFPDNEFAVRAYERVGFVHEGRVRELMFKSGRWHDLLLMSLLPGELRD